MLGLGLCRVWNWVLLDGVGVVCCCCWVLCVGGWVGRGGWACMLGGGVWRVSLGLGRRLGLNVGCGVKRLMGTV